MTTDNRESRMVVTHRDSNGAPTVWCDPEIVDLVTALNDGGLPTVASCSGHGEKFGNVALRDGRELLIAPDYDSARRAERAIAAVVPPVAQPAEGGVPASALRALIQAYVRLLETGRDRIRDLGGECDPVDVMERGDIDLRRAREALTAAGAAQGDDRDAANFQRGVEFATAAQGGDVIPNELDALILQYGNARHRDGANGAMGDESARLYTEIACGNWLLPAATQAAQGGGEAVDGWQHLAAAWLEQQAEDQEATNDKYPRHAESYKEWRDRPLILRMLAERVKKAEGSIKRHCPPPTWMFPDDTTPTPAAQPSDAFPTSPLSVFSDGAWTYGEDGRSYSATELDEAAFVAYRERLASSTPAAVGGDSESKRVIELIANRPLRFGEKWGGRDCVRCPSCLHRWFVGDDELHADGCYRQLARAAIAAEQGDAR